MNKFNVNSWVAKHYRLDNFDTRLHSVNNSLEFIWIWAIFEREIISKGVDNKSNNMEEKIISSLRETRLDAIDIQNCVTLFKKRYFDQNEKPTKYLKSLNFTNRYFNDLKCALLKEECSLEIRVKVLVLISYRFRCNLFHGAKDPLLWHEFEEVFFKIIQLLTQIIDNQTNIL